MLSFYPFCFTNIVQICVLNKSILVSKFIIQCNSSNLILHKPISMCMIGINGLNYPIFVDNIGSSIALLMLSNLIPAPQMAYTSLLVCRCTFVIISLIIYNYPATLSAINVTIPIILTFCGFTLGRALDPLSFWEGED